jgi:hypothetical protein
MYHEMHVSGFAMDTVAQMPMAILKDAADSRSMPVWINSVEAVALMAELVARDATARGDLLSSVLGQMGMTIESLTVDDLQKATFTAAAHLSGPQGTMTASVRIVDALGLSLRLQMPLLVADSVLEKASVTDQRPAATACDDDASRYVNFLESLDPADLGKYPL